MLDNLLTYYKTQINMLDPTQQVHFYKKLERHFILTPKMATSLELDVHNVCSVHLPLFYYHHNTYYLLANYWVYTLCILKNMLLLPAAVVCKVPSAECIRKIDKDGLIYFKSLQERSRTALKSNYKSRKSISRITSLQKGRICPYSNDKFKHILTTPRKKSLPDDQGLIQIQCINRSLGCNFRGDVTPYELNLLKHNKYATESWMELIPGSRCPICKNKPLYKRTMRITKNDLMIFKICRNYYNLNQNEHCGYMKPLKVK